MEAITYNTVDDSEAVCFVCQIHFLDIRDFRRHQESVRTGRGCGFEFHHYDTKCNGHHPRKFRTYENPDHLRFEEALRLVLGWTLANAAPDTVRNVANGAVSGLANIGQLLIPCFSLMIQKLTCNQDQSLPLGATSTLMLVQDIGSATV